MWPVTERRSEMSVAKLVRIICLECEDLIELSYGPRRGQVITCPMCDLEMEIFSVNPLRLELYYEDDSDDDRLDDEEGEWNDYRDESDVNDN
jgi:lysine biosynthesis protein LysW